MANTRSSRHGKRRRQACGLDLSPREVGHEDRHESSQCDLVNMGICVCFQIHNAMALERNHMNITCNQLDSVTMSADT
jgi:hypothetical protein